MRRTVRLALLSGVILGLVFTLGSGNASRGAYAREGCTNHSLRGAYGFASEGQVFGGTGTVVAEVAEVAAAGRVVFDGRGGLTGRETEGFSGGINNIPFTGSYSVQPDCTGTAIIQGGQQTAHLKLMLIEGGQEVNFIDKDPGVVAVGQISQQQLGRCTNASLKGTYNFASSGSFFDQTGELADVAVFGRIEFDGRGRDTESASASINGLQQDDLQTATYTVNPDCTGSAVSTHLGTGQQDLVNFVLVEGGTEVKFIVTNPGAVFAGTLDKASTEQDQQN